MRLRVIDNPPNEPFFLEAAQIEELKLVAGNSVLWNTQPFRRRAGKINKKFKRLFNHLNNYRQMDWSGPTGNW